MRYDEPRERIIFGNEANPLRNREGQYPHQDEILVSPDNERNPSDEGAPGKLPFTPQAPTADLDDSLNEVDSLITQSTTPKGDSQMKEYHGIYDANTQTRRVQVCTENGTDWLDLAASMEYVQHSPTGFNWGYGGSGPAQLAFALILDATGNPEAAMKFYQDFKRERIAHLADEWTLTETNIKGWIDQSVKNPA